MSKPSKPESPTETPAPLAPADPSASAAEGGEAAGFAALETTLGRFLATADVRRAWGEPVVHGDTALIPAAEVVSAFGMGLGAGGGEEPDGDRGRGGGGGGGGKTFARAVAVVVADPAGVRVEPVVDWTKLGLAALTAAGFVVAGWLRLRKVEKELRRKTRG